MIKLGQVLYEFDLIERHTSQGYRPLIKITHWVVCSIGKTKGYLTPIKMCNGNTIIKKTHVESPSIKLKKGEVVRNYFTSELQALRANYNAAKYNPFDKNESHECEFHIEWNTDMVTIKRRIDKLKVGK